MQWMRPTCHIRAGAAGGLAGEVELDAAGHGMRVDSGLGIEEVDRWNVMKDLMTCGRDARAP